MCFWLLFGQKIIKCDEFFFLSTEPEIESAKSETWS